MIEPHSERGREKKRNVRTSCNGKKERNYRDVGDS